MDKEYPAASKFQ